MAMSDSAQPPLQFQLRKLGHVVLNVTDLEASVRFYTEVLGLEISDRYPDSMVPGGMVFMRCNADHHGVALVGGATTSERTSLNHFAFEVAFQDPDGNNLEVYWGIDQVGTNGYVRPASEWRQARTLEDAIANLPPGQRLPLFSRDAAPEHPALPSLNLI